MRKQLNILRGVNFTYYSTQAVLTPFLPIYFQLQGFTPAQIGLLMMIGPFAATFAQPVWGYVSDHFQTTKKIIILLWSLALISSVGLFETSGFPAALTFITLLYFFVQPSVPILDSLTIKTAIAAKVPYGSIRLWGSIGYTVVAVASGSLIAYIGGVSNISYLYWAVWIFPIILLFIMKDERSAGQPINFKSLQIILKNKKFMWFLGLVFILCVPHRMNDGLIALYLDEKGASSTMIGLAWALASLSEAPVFAMVGRLLKRYHELALIGIAASVYVLRWLLVASINDPLALTVLQLMHSVTFGLFWIVAVQYAVRLVPENLRSTGQSLLSAVFLGMAGITGGVIGGWINGNWGGAAMYYFASAVSFVAALLFLSTHFYYRRKNI